jgi:hypothetical protein
MESAFHPAGSKDFAESVSGCRLMIADLIRALPARESHPVEAAG